MQPVRNAKLSGRMKRREWSAALPARRAGLMRHQALARYWLSAVSHAAFLLHRSIP